MLTDALAEDVQTDLNLLRAFRTPTDPSGLAERLGRMRDLLFHYPEMLNPDCAEHEELRGALDRVRDDVGEVVTGPTFRSVRFTFADDLAAGLILGGALAPEGNPDDARRAAIEPLVAHIRDGLTAAMRFGVAVADSYVSAQSSDRVQFEKLDD